MVNKLCLIVIPTEQNKSQIDDSSFRDRAPWTDILSAGY